MKKVICCLLITTFFCVYASTSYGAKPLDKGDCVEEDSVCFTTEEAKELKKQLIELDYLKLQYKEQEKMTNLWKNGYKDLEKENTKLRKSKEWTKWVYFGLGVVLVSISVKCAGELK